MQTISEFLNDHVGDPPIALARRLFTFLIEHFPGQNVIYTLDDDVSPYDFAKAGECEISEDDQFENQVSRYPYQDEEGNTQISNSEFASYNLIEWQGHSLSLLSITTPGKYSDDTRHFLISDSAEIGSAFLTAISAWRHQTKHQILEFSSG